MRYPTNDQLHKYMNSICVHLDLKTVSVCINTHRYPLEGRLFRFDHECASVLEATLLHAFLLGAVALILNAALEYGYRAARDKKPKWWAVS